MSNSRGRPLGFRLSEESKRAISESKKGQRHSEATKEKISRTLLSYFRNMYPLSQELYDNYEDIIRNSPEIKDWFDSIKSSFDQCSGILTERSLNSKRFREISIEYNIDMTDNIYANKITVTPERICELKEQCSICGLDYNEVFTILGVNV